MSGPGERRAALIARLAGGAGPLLADGSTGTALCAQRPEALPRLALLPLEEPELVEALHRAYFRAGSELVETATFQASAAGLVGFAGRGGPEAANELAYRVNLEAARAARRAAAAAERASGGAPRFVAGSIGPGDRPPSLGAASWAELRASYLPQARGLAEGGCDLAIVETCQDPLQIKAALAALAAPEGGRGLPFVVSATVDGRGRLLAGTSLAALVDIVGPFRPLALGLNCSGGPAELALPLAELAALSPFPLSFMPNAGLPCVADDCAIWPLGAEAFAEGTAELARRHGVALVGGCCGTGPEAIQALARRLEGGYAIGERPRARPALASLYESRPLGPALFRIGERANAAGSAAFSALVKAGDLEAAAALALRQEEAGAEALDLHLSRPGRDEAADLEAMARMLNGSAHAALCLDSRDPEAFAAALPRIGGRALLNSTSLESVDKARRVLGLAREFGAAVVCLALDAAGPARRAEEKAAVCRSLYELATRDLGLAPADLFFDPLVFTALGGASGAAAETLAALPLIKAACPGSHTILGVGNVSHGLPRAARPALTAVFLSEARKAGLDAAILDAGRLPEPGELEPKTREAALALLRGERREGFDPLAILLKAAEGGGEGESASAAAEEEARGPEAALRRALLRGEREASLALALAIARRGEAAQSGAAARDAAVKGGADQGEAAARALVSEAASQAVAEAGRLWTAGKLPLPLVLRTAEAARAVLGLLPAGGAGKGEVVMATVRGDLHDIGKNIAAAIISCSGYRVIDLGTDVPAERMARALAETGALALGLSGLLTQSLAEMRQVCERLEAAGSPALVLLGGAAVDADYVARFIEPAHPGKVLACADAFQGLARLEALRGEPELSALGAKGPGPAPAREGRARVACEAAEASTASKKTRVFAAERALPLEPPFLGARLISGLAPASLFGALERASLFHARWGYRRGRDSGPGEGPAEGGFAEAELELARLENSVLESGLLDPKAAIGFFRCRREGQELLVEEEGPGGAPRRFRFPREAGGKARSLADYYRAEGDLFCAFAVTIGGKVAEAARALRGEGRLAEYWRLHGLGSALAEALAELAHERMGELLAGRGLPRGRRYSFGFPRCPGLEFQADLLSLLHGEAAGIRVTEGFQLSPEHSVSAFVLAREDAEYF